MNKLIHSYQNWLHTEYEFKDPKAISAFRVLFSILVLFFGQFSFRSVADGPMSLYNPKGSLAIWFDLPSSQFFIALDYTILIALIFMLFGFQTKWSSLVFAISIIIGNSFKYSFGKVDHGLLFLTFVPLIMAFSNWGRYYSIDEKLGKRDETQSWPVSVLAFFIGFGMMTAGLQKLLGGWLNPNFQAIKFHLFKSYLNLREGPWTEYFINIKSTFFWEVLDYFIVFFELGFLIAVFRSGLFKKWVILALIFHVGVFFTLDITFSHNIPAYFLFMDWTVIMSVLGFGTILRFFDKGITIKVLIPFLLLFLYFKFSFGSPYIHDLLDLGRSSRSLLMFSLAMIVVLTSCILWFKSKTLAKG